MPDISRRLGYGGSAVISGQQVLITGGSMEEADTPSFLEMMDIPPLANQSRSKILHADGTKGYTGTLSFDMTLNALNVFTAATMFSRRYLFNMGIHDGEAQWEMNGCYLTTLSLTGAPGGLIGASLSFVATTGKTGGVVLNNYILDDYYGVAPSVGNQPAGYWWSGGADIKEWTFTMNQTVEAVYLNQDTPEPKYLKVGLIEYTLDATLYSALTPNLISIMTDTFTLSGVTTGKGYTFNGVSDLGMYTHNFTTAPLGSSGSDANIINIT